MANKYIEQNNGDLNEVEGLDVSAGVGDAGKIPALNSLGQIDLTMMPTGIGPDTASIEAGENLAAGDFVNIYDDLGTTKVRKAVATGLGTRAHGYVLAAFTTGQTALVYFEGNNDQLSGKTGGTQYFLSETAGLSAAIAPSTSGSIVQKIGVASSETSINFERGQVVTLA